MSERWPAVTSSEFSAELQTRLRAALAKQTGRAVPRTAMVEVVADADGDSSDSRGLDRRIELRATDRASRFYASCEYDEPGAWSKLLVDMEAFPDPMGENEQGWWRRMLRALAGHSGT